MCVSLIILETELSVWQAVLSKLYIFYVFYDRGVYIFVFTVVRPKSEPNVQQFIFSSQSDSIRGVMVRTPSGQTKDNIIDT
jgi:hypothetical protein